MTLNISVISPKTVAQASDRRFTSVNGLKDYPEKQNKAIVCFCTDGRILITFTGIAENNKVGLGTH